LAAQAPQLAGAPEVQSRGRMATTKRRQLTDEQRAQRRRQEQELTERAVAQLCCSEGWQRWLQVRGRLGLRRYSLIISRTGVIDRV
jgi:hypothetical protein